VNPGVHDKAARRQAYSFWKGSWNEERHKKHEEKQKVNEEMHKAHTEMRSNMLVKYFSEKVNPGVHDKAMNKEAFALWKSEFEVEMNSLKEQRWRSEDQFLHESHENTHERLIAEVEHLKEEAEKARWEQKNE
jgi:hypothetical protein